MFSGEAMKKILQKIPFHKIFWEVWNIYQVSFLIITTLAFGIFCIYALIFEFWNLNKNNFILTNYAFVILLGLASICFSWSKSLPIPDVVRAKRIYRNGIDALNAAIMLLLGAGFKYVILFYPKNLYLSTYIKEYPKILFLPKILTFFFFTQAAIGFYNVIDEILKTIIHVKSEEVEPKNKDENINSNDSIHQTDSVALVENKNTKIN